MRFLLVMMMTVLCGCSGALIKHADLLTQVAEPVKEMQKRDIADSSLALERRRQNYLDSLKKNPDNALALYNLGVILDKKGNHRKANRYYQKAIISERMLVDAYYNLGYNLIVQKDYETALEVLTFADWLTPDTKDILHNLEIALYRAIIEKVRHGNAFSADNLFGIFAGKFGQSPYLRQLKTCTGHLLLHTEKYEVGKKYLIEASALKLKHTLKANNKYYAGEALFLLGQYHRTLADSGHEIKDRFAYLKQAAAFFKQCARLKTTRILEAMLNLERTYFQMAALLGDSESTTDMRSALTMYRKSHETLQLADSASLALTANPASNVRKLSSETMMAFYTAQSALMDRLFKGLNPSGLKDSVIKTQLYNIEVLKVICNICLDNASWILKNIDFAHNRVVLDSLLAAYKRVRIGLFDQEIIILSNISEIGHDNDNFGHLADLHTEMNTVRSRFVKEMDAMLDNIRPVPYYEVYNEFDARKMEYLFKESIAVENDRIMGIRHEIQSLDDQIRAFQSGTEQEN
jgi:tetratricopeptide (TPR) repeat protein